MDDTPDMDLLRRFAAEADEDALAQLVNRHCTLVWATARRVSGDPEVARDITQSVFTLLARKAGRLPLETSLSGWLHRAAHLEAVKHLRRERRRKQREKAAMNEFDTDSTSPDAHRAAEQLQPFLDEALAGLGNEDRLAIVLRYLSGQSLTQVGRALGTNEDAAQKRVSRALDKLRARFRGRGISVSDGLVSAALGHAGLQSAPVDLAGAVAAAAALGGGTAGSALVSGVLIMKTTLIIGTATLAVASLLAWQQTRIGRLAEENARLRNAVSAGAAAAGRPSNEAPQVDSRSRDVEEHAELLRLRGEVARLRASTGGGIAAAEVRARNAEAEAEAVRREVAFRQRRMVLIEAGKTLGMAARVFATRHQDRLPTTWIELNEAMREMGLTESDESLSAASSDTYEFFPNSTPLNLKYSQQFLIRERQARPIPKAVMTAGDLGQSTPFSLDLGTGWEREYVLMDGSVQTVNSRDGDFSEFERSQFERVASDLGTDSANP